MTTEDIPPTTGKDGDMPGMTDIGLQEPPDDPRIFNRKRKDGAYRPISEFFEPEEAEQGAGE